MNLSEAGKFNSYQAKDSFCISNFNQSFYCLWKNKYGEIIGSEKIKRRDHSIIFSEAFPILQKKMHYFAYSETFKKYFEKTKSSLLALVVLESSFAGIKSNYDFSEDEWSTVLQNFKDYYNSKIQGNSWLPDYYNTELVESLYEVRQSLRQSELKELLELFHYSLGGRPNTHGIHYDMSWIWNPKDRQRLDSINQEAQALANTYSSWNKKKIKNIQSFLLVNVTWIIKVIEDKGTSKEGSFFRSIFSKIALMSQYPVMGFKEEIHFLQEGMSEFLKTELSEIKELIFKRSYTFDKNLAESLWERFFVGGASMKDLLKNSYAQRKSLRLMRSILKQYLKEDEFRLLDRNVRSYEYLVGDFLNKYIKDFKLEYYRKESIPLINIDTGLRNTEDLRKNLELQLIVLRTSAEIAPRKHKTELGELMHNLSTLIIEEKFHKREVERAKNLTQEIAEFSRVVFFEHAYLDVRNSFIQRLATDMENYED